MILGVLDWMRPDRSVGGRKMLDDVARAGLRVAHMLGNHPRDVDDRRDSSPPRPCGPPGPACGSARESWAGVVDSLPLVGGLLAGVPTVAVAVLHSLPQG